MNLRLSSFIPKGFFYHLGSFSDLQARNSSDVAERGRFSMSRNTIGVVSVLLCTCNLYSSSCTLGIQLVIACFFTTSSSSIIVIIEGFRTTGYNWESFAISVVILSLYGRFDGNAISAQSAPWSKQPADSVSSFDVACVNFKQIFT